MKGVVFTAFLEMVERHYGEDTVDDIIDAAHLPSGGAYTAIGTYPHEEMVALVAALSERTGLSVSDLLRAYGRHLFAHFHATHPRFFHDADNALAFLSRIEDIIHAEVLKLYPDAQLPRLRTEHHSDRQLVLVYQSGRHFEDLAEGLMAGCIEHFGEHIEIERQVIDRQGQRLERFTLTRR